MQIRTRIFLSVGTLFVASLSTFALIRHYQIEYSLQSAEEVLKREIVLMDEKRRDDVLAYLSINVAETESHINTVFTKIQEHEWLRAKYAPTNYNYKTNDWSSSSVLMASNPWIDMIQTVARDKLTSLIIRSPPYLSNCIRVAIDDFLSVIVFQNEKGTFDAYIGVPYWSNAATNDLKLGIDEMIFNNKEDHDEWLIFTIDQILNMKKEDMIPKNLEIPAGPLEPSIALKGSEIFKQVIDLTIEMVLVTKEKIQAYPEWIARLKSDEEWQAWASENIRGHIERLTSNASACTSSLCKQFEEKFDTAYWNALGNWTYRYDENELIWELSTITASGIWDFEPLEAKAPKGIVSFLRRENAGVTGSEPYLGLGLLAKEVFSDQKFPLFVDCELNDSLGQDATCISSQLQIVHFPNRNGIFLTNSMMFRNYEKGQDEASIGYLTLGVNISPMLQKLVLASQNSVLFVNKQGQKIAFNEQGQMKLNTPMWGNLDVNHLLTEKMGTIKDIEGKEYLFVHVTSLTEDDGHVFIIQLHQSAFQLLGELSSGTRSLMHKLFIELICAMIIAIGLVLFLLDRILKKTVAPLQNLAIATKAVGSGNLTQVVIPDVPDNKKDEVSILCKAFKQMVDEIQAGQKVRDILNKVVSKEVAQKILAGGVELSGEMREVTILFSDIRNFTQMAEKMDPHAVLDLLNECLTLLSGVIDEHAGVIDKYVGDEIMAIFGAPVETRNAALEAVLCASEMRCVLLGWNRQRIRRGLLPLEIGIGIHTGYVISGNIGAENHLSYTVLGHNVNVASRVCNHAKEMEILITESTLNAPSVRDNIQYKALDPVLFKGISAPVQLYQVL